MPEQKEAQQPNQEITTTNILDSIEQVEKWWPQLDVLLKSNNGDQTMAFIKEAVSLYNTLEQVAQDPSPVTPKDILSISVLWDISAPGTFFEGEKRDRYKGKKWALWGDRKRLNHAFSIGRTIASARAGRFFEGNSPKTLAEMEEYLPYIVYNGRPDENVALMEAIATPWLKIPEGLGYPRSRVSIISPVNREFDNSYSLADQIQTFRVPNNLDLSQGGEVGVVISAAQAVRFLYGLNNVENKIPGNRPVRIFPLPTPQSGIPEYPIQEIRGTIFYGLIATPPVVADKPYPYKI